MSVSRDQFLSFSKATSVLGNGQNSVQKLRVILLETSNKNQPKFKDSPFQMVRNLFTHQWMTKQQALMQVLQEWCFIQLGGVTKVNVAHALHQNCFHKEKKMCYCHRRREQKDEYAEQTHFLGKSAASLVSRLKTWRESSLPWYSPLILICHYSSRQAGMKLEQEGWGQSTESSGAWDNWLRAEEHKLFCIVPAAGNEEGRNKKSQQINTWPWAWWHWQDLGVLIMGSFTQQQICWWETGKLSEGEKDLCKEWAEITEGA